VAQHQGDYALAIRQFEASYAVVQALDHRPLRAALLHRLGNLATIQGMPARAVERLQEGLALWRYLGSALGIVTCLEGLAAALVAGPRHSAERDQGAVWLWAAASAQREAMHAPQPLAESLFYTPYLHAARTYLGETGYALAVQTGRAMPLEQAVAYARQLVPDAQQPPSTAATGPEPLPPSPPGDALHSLSERELEVLRLVATGLPDKAIAARLVISPRTVHAHLASIYGKLGVNSRHAATLFALEHRLAPLPPRVS
jgi:non-specific serine/threonine protein kinase